MQEAFSRTPGLVAHLDAAPVIHAVAVIDALAMPAASLLLVDRCRLTPGRRAEQSATDDACRRAGCEGAIAAMLRIGRVGRKKRRAPQAGGENARSQNRLEHG